METEKRGSVRTRRTSEEVKGIIAEINDLLSEVGTNTQIRISGRLNFAALGINLSYGDEIGNCGGGCFGCAGCNGCPGCEGTSSTAGQMGGEVINPDPTRFRQVAE